MNNAENILVDTAEIIHQARANRVRKRALELEFFDVNTSMAVSEEIEQKINIPPQDNELIKQGSQLQETYNKLSGEYYGYKTIKEDDSSYVKIPTRQPTHVRKMAIEVNLRVLDQELQSIEQQRTQLFIASHPELFYGIPQPILEVISHERAYEKPRMEELSMLLALPYHLQKMRSDGVTEIVASATSSIPYCILLKKLDELLYPDQLHIKFLLFSTKAKGEGIEKQNAKLLNYFEGKPEAHIGVFDECASSNVYSQYNRRNTVSGLANNVESLLRTTVVGRYGTDAIYPVFRTGKEITLDTNGHGDEGKSHGLFAMINLLSDDKLKDKAQLKLFNSISYNEPEITTDSIGYRREEHGAQGLEIIKKLEMLADIVYKNYLKNPDSIWNPMNNNIRSLVDYSYEEDSSQRR